MKASKFIVSTLAAGSVVAAVGFAYAQTTPTPSDPAYQTPQTQTQSDPMRANQPMPSDANNQMQRPMDSTTRTDRMNNSMNNNMNNNPSTTSIDNSNMSSERMARADRN